MGNEEKNVVLIIADISGYTKFMIDNSKTLFHAQTVITELLTAVIKQVKVPLKVSKIEGDAVFLYAVKSSGDEEWERRKRKIKTRIIDFFTVFALRVSELTGSNTCECNACTMVAKLKLKVVVHTGTAVFYKIGKFYEISGVDVILVHRLLKNSIESNEYMLFTKQAFEELHYEGEMQVVASKEKYDDSGEVETRIYYPTYMTNEAALDFERAKYKKPFYKMKNMMAKMMTMMSLKKKTPVFKNLPEPDSK